MCVWFPNKVQTHKKKSPWKSPFLTWISPVVLPNLTKTLGWVNKIGLHLIYQQDFKFWGFRILNHENLKTANFSGFQDSKSSIVKILKNKLLFSSWNSRFWRKGNPFSSLLNEIFSRAKILREKNQFFLSILPSIFLPKLVRNHILLFGWILTSSILQKGKVFDKDSSVFLSNILISVNKGTLVMVFSDTQSLFWNWTSEVRTPLCGGDNF